MRLHEHLACPSLSELEAAVPDELADSMWTRLQAEIATDGSGQLRESRSWRGRETFYWENLMDAVIEQITEPFGRTLRAKYPNLTPEQRGEIVGLVKGGLWSAMDQGLMDASGDEEDQIVSAFIGRTAEQATKAVRGGNPQTDEQFFRDVLRQLDEDEDDRLGDFLEDKLPGVELAVNTEIVFRLNMPGRVTASNAHERDGATLVWRFSPTDAANVPVEIYAESIVER